MEKYYPLAQYVAATNSTQLGVLEAIAHIKTDSDFKCVGYEGLLSAARKNIPVWTYEYTHNNTCAWLGSLASLQAYPEALTLEGATHTAEIPFVFGNMDGQPLPGGPCNATEAEYHLSEQMMSLWTAMAKNTDPSTDAIQWPRFSLGRNASTPGLIFANSALSGEIDYSICQQLWSKLYIVLGAENGTATTTPISGSGKPTVSPSATP